MRTLLLSSGGLDSTLILSLLIEEGRHGGSLFVDYGQLAASREWVACQSVHRALGAQPPQRVDVSGVGGLLPSGLTASTKDRVHDAYLPGRNTLLLLLGAAYAVQIDCTSIAVGLLDDKTNLFADQTSAHLRHVEALLGNAVGVGVSVLAPLKGFVKADVVRMAAARGITGTYSCHSGDAVACGVCISCNEFTTSQGD